MNEQAFQSAGGESLKGNPERPEGDHRRPSHGGKIRNHHQTRHKKNDGQESWTDEEPQRTEAHRLNGLDLLGDGHGAEFRGVSGPDPGRDHDPRHQRTELTGKSNSDQRGHKTFLSIGLELISREERHRQADKKRDESDQRD